MYVALFLTPWMTMYALSTFFFNHFQHFDRMYGGHLERVEKEREMVYSRTFAADATPRAIGEQILRDLNLAGGFQAKRTQEEDEPEKIVVDRFDPLAERTITYLPAEKKLLIEKHVFRTPGFLTRLHSRVGYGSKYKANQVWAVGVDLSIFGTILWVFSGFWLWWELRVTRRWGALFTIAGLALFGAFFVFA